MCPNRCASFMSFHCSKSCQHVGPCECLKVFLRVSCVSPGPSRSRRSPCAQSTKRTSTCRHGNAMCGAAGGCVRRFYMGRSFCPPSNQRRWFSFDQQAGVRVHNLFGGRVIIHLSFALLRISKPSTGQSPLDTPPFSEILN